MLTAFLLTLMIVQGYMIIWYIIAIRKQNFAVVDIAWGGGFILIALFNLFVLPGITLRQLGVTLLVCIWGLRLGVHLFRRNWNKPEDFRYNNMRQKWGEKANARAFRNVFAFQGVWMIVIGYPIVLIQVFSATSLTLWDGIGICVWVVGFLFESISDHQLHLFVKCERTADNSIMTKGLWRYSRHPNYFGESMMWWGIYLITLSVPGGYLGLLSPLSMTFLLVYVSGIPILEKKYTSNQAYQEYAKRTSIFIPWFPRKHIPPRMVESSGGTSAI